MFKYSKNKSKKRLWNIPAATALWIFCISKLCDSYSYSQWAFWLWQHCTVGLFAVAMHTPYTRHLSVSVRIQYVASDNSGSHYKAISVMLYTLETIICNTAQYPCTWRWKKYQWGLQSMNYIFIPHTVLSVSVYYHNCFTWTLFQISYLALWFDFYLRVHSFLFSFMK